MAYTPGTKMPEQTHRLGRGSRRAGEISGEGDDEVADAHAFAFVARLLLALAQIILGGAHRRRAACRRDRSPPRSSTATRQSSHILMTSRRRAEPLNIQCLPSSLAATRSIVLLTPNGLPQRMQWNGSSSLSTRAERGGGAEVDLRREADDLLRAGRLAQPALHAGVLGEAQHRPLGIVRQRAGRAGRHAGEAERAALDIDLDRAERRAGRQRDDIDRRGRRALQFAEREPHHVALAADRRKARRPRRRRAARRWRAASRRAHPDRRSRWSATRPPPKPRPGEDRLRQRDGLAQARRRRGAASRAAGSARRSRHRRRPRRSPRGRPASPR